MLLSRLFVSDLAGGFGQCLDSAEARAVFPRCHADKSLEPLREVGRGGKPAPTGDFGEREPSFQTPELRFFDPASRDVAMGRRPRRRLEGAGKRKGLGPTSSASVSIVRSLSCGTHVGMAQRHQRWFRAPARCRSGDRRSLAQPPPPASSAARSQNTQDSLVKSVR